MRPFVFPLLAVVGGLLINDVQAQTPMIGKSDPRVAALLESNGIVPVSGCSSCAVGPSLDNNRSPGIWGCRNCGGHGCDMCNNGCDGCGESGCIPGRQPCVTCEGQSRVGRLFCAFHNALACPDPCYEPRWIDAANASFYTDSARPWTMTRLRWDAGRRVNNPDRAEYLIAATGAGGKGFPLAESRANYDEFRMYQEFANGSFSMFVDMGLRSLRGDVNGGSGGFADMYVGSKTMFLDSELITMTFQMRTAIPTGNVTTGSGTGHVSLEPSLLTTLKVACDTYFQTQTGLSAPIAGTSAVAGNVLFYRGSLNHVICRPLADTSFIGTFEFEGLTFTNGTFTPPAGPRQSANANTFAIGPGFRLAISNRVDAGLGTLFNVTSTRLEENRFRTELRWRY